MHIDSILSADRTICDLSVASKKRTIEAIAKIFADSISDLDLDTLIVQLNNRERLGSTGIGNGIAIPHCRFSTHGKTYGACITLSTPIDFNAIDNQPVDIIFAMLVPENEESSHLETLSHLAETFQSPEFVSKVRTTSSSADLYKQLTDQL